MFVTCPGPMTLSIFKCYPKGFSPTYLSILAWAKRSIYPKVAWRAILVRSADSLLEESVSAHGKKGGVGIGLLLVMYTIRSQTSALVAFVWLAMRVFQSWDPAAALLTWNHSYTLFSSVNWWGLWYPPAIHWFQDSREYLQVAHHSCHISEVFVTIINISVNYFIKKWHQAQRHVAIREHLPKLLLLMHLKLSTEVADFSIVVLTFGQHLSEKG